MDQICQVCLIPYLLHRAGTQQVQPAGWDKSQVLVVPAPVPSQQQGVLSICHLAEYLNSVKFPTESASTSNEIWEYYILGGKTKVHKTE